eukprot:PhM_4_TR16732/c7_g2_i2/m.30466
MSRLSLSSSSRKKGDRVVHPPSQRGVLRSTGHSSDGEHFSDRPTTTGRHQTSSFGNTNITLFAIAALVIAAATTLVGRADAFPPSTCAFPGRGSYGNKGTCHHVGWAVRVGVPTTIRPFDTTYVPDMIDTSGYDAKRFIVTATPSVNWMKAQGGASGLTIPAAHPSSYTITGSASVSVYRGVIATLEVDVALGVSALSTFELLWELEPDTHTLVDADTSELHYY